MTTTITTGPISIFSRGTYTGSETQRLKRECDELREMLESFREKACATGLVTGIYEQDSVRIATILVQNQTIERKLLPWAEGKARIGMTVRIMNDGGVPVSFAVAPPGGLVVSVDRLHKGAVEYTVQGCARLAATDLECKPGDSVSLDATGAVVVANLGPAKRAKPVTEATGVDWDDIGGLEDVKRDLREAVEGPVLHAETYRRYGMKTVKGILLSGVPGTGKSMLCKAVATALAKVHGKSAQAGGVIWVKGPELLHGLVGQSESNVRQLFASARAHHAEHGYPAVIVLDEADGLLSGRGRNAFEGIERTVVPTFLAEMDGIEATGALVILATNRPEAIDPAFLRDGRVDLRLTVPPPTKGAFEDIVAKCLRGRPFSPPELPALVAEEVFSDRHVVAMTKSEKGGRERQTVASFGPTGALAAGLVERATQVAMRRALAGDDTGITLDDVKACMASVVADAKRRAGVP